MLDHPMLIIPHDNWGRECVSTTDLDILLLCASSFPPFGCYSSTSIAAHSFECDVPSAPADCFSWWWIHKEVSLCVWLWKNKHAIVLGNRRQRKSKRNGVYVSLVYYKANHAKLQTVFQSLSFPLLSPSNDSSLPFPSTPIPAVEPPTHLLSLCSVTCRADANGPTS